MRWLAFLLLTALLAGCAGTDEPTDDTPDAVDRDDFQFAAGKGAIAGLLVDDRFRPIDLEPEGATGEFQSVGFILLQETGEQKRTNENGEFTFTNLDPGTYTIRTQSEKHEATPQKVQVTEGEFTELNVVARRTASDDSVVISEEYSAFVPCGVNLIVIGTSLDCTFDQSGDSERVAFTVDYTSYDNALALVHEMRSNQPQFYDIWVQQVNNQVCSGAYNIEGGPDTTYIRMQFMINEAHPEGSGSCGNLVWDNSEPMQTVVYLNSLGYEEGIGFGLGFYIGVQANFVLNLFLGELPQNIDEFCAYC